MFSFKASGEELPRNNSDDTVADNVEAPTKVNNYHQKIHFIVDSSYTIAIRYEINMSNIYL